MNKTLLVEGLSVLAILLSSCAGTSPAAMPATAAVSAASPTVAQPPPASPTITLPPDPATQAPIAQASFANDVMPIFQATCVKCHGKEQIKAGLDLRTYETTMQGSFKGVVIVPGDAANSFLVQQVVNGKMPKLGQKLTAEQIQIITDWVNTGAQNN